MNNVHQLTRGAVFLAIYSVLLLITIYIPVLGMIVNFVLPLPFIIFAAKNNMKSTIVFLTAAILISLIIGGFLAIPLTTSYGMTGAAIGYLLHKQKGRWLTFLVGSLVFLVNIVVQYIISVVFFKINFIKEFLQTFEESIKTSTKMMESLGQTANPQVIDQLQASIALMETLMPSMFVMASFMVVFFIQLISVPILKRFDISVTDWKPFRELELPKSLLYYYLICLASSLFLSPAEGSYMYWALTNLVFVLQLFMVIQGISFVFYFSHAKGFAKSFPIISLVLLFILPFLLYLVRILGIIDLGFNLRKRLEKNQK
jgi:uncharacterized protein YybS (DUF2232 family)